MTKLFTLVICLLSVIAGSAQQPTAADTAIVADFLTSFDGTRIYYEVRGKGEPVVLVHGFIVNGETWKKTALYKDLVSSGYKVIALDMRGNGKSDKPHTAEAYANDAEAKDIMALTKKLGVTRYAAVGYSRGAIIVSRLLVLDKNIRVGVIGGMGSDFTNPEWPRRIMFYEALMGKEVKELEGMVKYVKDSGLDQLALGYLQKEQPSTSKQELGRIKQPVLVICGTEDSDNGSSKDLAALFKKAEYASVPGNHNNASRSPEFSTSVIGFIKEKK